MDYRQIILDIVKSGQKNSGVNFAFHIGIVLTDDECAGKYNALVGRDTFFDQENYVVAVKILTDKSGDSDSTTTFDANGNPGGTNTDTPTIQPYVRLMVGVADGPLRIPRPGSNVIVMVSDWHESYIIQYSDVVIYQNSSQNHDKTIKTSQNLVPGEAQTEISSQDSTGAQTGGSEFTQKVDEISMFVGPTGTTIGIDIKKDLFDVNIQNKTTFIQTDQQIDLKVDTGLGQTTEFLQTTSRFSMKTNSDSLKGLMSDISNLMLGANAPVGSGGGPLVLLAPVTLNDGTIVPTGPVGVGFTDILTRLSSFFS